MNFVEKPKITIRIPLSEVRSVSSKPSENPERAIGPMTVIMKDGTKRKFNETFLRDNDVLFLKDR